MEHVFGYDADKTPLAQRERLCTEPEVKGATYERIYHPVTRMLEDGDVVCVKCGESFMGTIG